MSGEDELFIDVASPEDLILHKLVWYRKGNETSERQWLDILAILKLQAVAVDSVYLADWAERLKVLDLWKRVQAEAASLPNQQS